MAESDSSEQEKLLETSLIFQVGKRALCARAQFLANDFKHLREAHEVGLLLWLKVAAEPTTLGTSVCVLEKVSEEQVAQWVIEAQKASADKPARSPRKTSKSSKKKR